MSDGLLSPDGSNQWVWGPITLTIFVAAVLLGIGCLWCHKIISKQHHKKKKSEVQQVVTTSRKGPPEEGASGKETEA